MKKPSTHKNTAANTEGTIKPEQGFSIKEEKKEASIRSVATKMPHCGLDESGGAAPSSCSSPCAQQTADVDKSPRAGQNDPSKDKPKSVVTSGIPNEKKKEFFRKFRVNPRESAGIDSRLPEGWTFSKWMRHLALRQPVPKHDPALVAAINRYGNNLNQIARALNTANLVGDEVDLLKVRATLDEIRCNIQQLLDKPSGE